MVGDTHSCYLFAMIVLFSCVYCTWELRSVSRSVYWSRAELSILLVRTGVF